MFLVLIIKILAGINLLLGLLFRKRTPKYAPEEIKSVLVKRTDRIGDAVATLPLLLELNKRFKLTVLSSQYNDSFLSEFVATKVFVEKPLPFPKGIWMILKNSFSLLKKRKDALYAYDLFLDLNGIRELDVFLKVRTHNLCKYYASFNMGIWNVLLDYADKRYPVMFTDREILRSGVHLAAGALGIQINVLPDGIEFFDKMQKPKDFNLEKFIHSRRQNRAIPSADINGVALSITLPDNNTTGLGPWSKERFILVNISGIKRYRGPAPRYYAEVLNALERKERIVIMDEPGRPNFLEFKKHLRKDNVTYIEQDLSLWELAYVASRSLLYIGADSGISHLLQLPTHAILFFATGIPEVWRPYSKNPYQRRTEGDILIDETITSCGLRKKIIYGKSLCRPCFDIGCRLALCIKRIERAKDIVTDEIEGMFS